MSGDYPMGKCSGIREVTATNIQSGLPFGLHRLEGSTAIMMRVNNEDILLIGNNLKEFWKQIEALIETRREEETLQIRAANLVRH